MEVQQKNSKSLERDFPALRDSHNLRDLNVCYGVSSSGREDKSSPITKSESSNLVDLNVCYGVASGEKQENSSASTKNRAAKAEDSELGALCTWIVEHQLGIAINLLLLEALTHICFPRARPQTRKLFDLSYYNPSTGRYTLGWDDIFMVFHWIIVFTGLRVAVMDYVLVPFARSAGISKKKERVRFAEQAWIYIYYAAFWSLGMYLMYNSKYWFNLPEAWSNWPDREMDGLFKWYYLVQFAFWLQQIIVVNIEERRKDYAQMFTHHLITCALMLCSYGYHQTRIGNVVLCLMDSVDTIFPLAKMLKYLKYQLACDIAFGVFMVAWFITRHVFFCFVVWSVYSHSVIEIEPPHYCYSGSNQNLHGPMEIPNRFEYLLQPFLNPEGVVCWSDPVRLWFVGLLVFLQVLLLIWFTMIIKVASKVVKGGEAEDSRSGDEEEDKDEKVQKKGKLRPKTVFIEVPPLEEEVGVEAINLSNRKASPSGKYKKGVGTASGVTLNSDRKELLGRIGCDKSA